MNLLTKAFTLYSPIVTFYLISSWLLRHFLNRIYLSADCTTVSTAGPNSGTFNIDGTDISTTGWLFGSSGTSSFFFVADDTGVNNILYRDWDFDGGATTAGDFNPYTKQ